MTTSRFWLCTAGLCFAAAIAFVVYAVDAWKESPEYARYQTEDVRFIEDTYPSYMSVPNYNPPAPPPDNPVSFTCTGKEQQGLVFYLNSVPNTATVSLQRYDDAFLPDISDAELPIARM